jgi:hypothetical protein
MTDARAKNPRRSSDAAGPEYLSVPDAMRRLRMSRASLYRYVMPHVQVLRVGRMVRIPIRELERWEAERTHYTL